MPIYESVSITSLGIFRFQFVCNYLYLHSASAQNSTSVNFLMYQNPTLGFTLQHPSNWKVNDEDRSSDGLVQFFTPNRKDYDDAIFVVSVHNVTRSI